MKLAATLDRLTAAAAWLVLPLALLLFLQWPLRDAVGAWSRQTNDIAQWVFALYVAIAIRAATRGRVHMAAGLFAAGPHSRWRRLLARNGEALCVLPWAVFVLVSGAAPTWRSLVALESFPDTGNPHYFLIRIAAWLLALLMALQALLELAGQAPMESDPAPPRASR
ncbi:MAG: C4-dicarboxylate ABC transporter substrate-binding protein [Rubrivivax sp.]